MHFVAVHFSPFKGNSYHNLVPVARRDYIPLPLVWRTPLAITCTEGIRHRNLMNGKKACLSLLHIFLTKAHIPLETGFALGKQTSAKILRWGPNANYIPLTGVGG